MESSDSPWVTMFVCANCVQGEMLPTSSDHIRSTIPDFGLPGRVDSSIIPCAGHIQTEHVLKVLEDGSDVVAVVACEDKNCHYSEGSRRCALRVEYIRSLVEEIGLGDGRIVLAHFSGTTVEDTLQAAEVNEKIESPATGSLEQKIKMVRDQVLEALRIVSPNPFSSPEKKTSMSKSSSKEGGW